MIVIDMSPASPDARRHGCICPNPSPVTSAPTVSVYCQIHGCTCLHSMHGRVRNPGCNIHGTATPSEPKG